MHIDAQFHFPAETLIQTVVRMKYQTALIMLAAGAIHIVCFALVISAVKVRKHGI